MNRETLLSPTIFAGLFAIYAVGALSTSIWYDESITLYTIAGGADYVETQGLTLIGDLKHWLTGLTTPPDVVSTLITDDVHPPLYFILLNIWSYVFGTSITAARLLSVLFATLSVFIFHRIMREHRPDYAISSTLVFALSSLVVFSASTARSGSLIILLSTIAILLATRRPKQPGAAAQPKTEILLGVVAAGLLLTHYFTALVVVPVMMHRGQLLLQRRDWRYLAAPLAGILLFLPWFPAFLHHLNVRPDQGSGFGGILTWANILVRRSAEVIVSPAHHMYPKVLVILAKGIVLAVTIIGGAYAALSLVKAPAKWSIEIHALFVCGMGFVLLTILFIATDKMMSPLSYFTAFFPFLVILTTFGLQRVGALLKLHASFLQAAPFAGLIILQASMLNFGYEKNAKSDGNYLKSLSQNVTSFPADDTLVLIDSGDGRGDVLNAVSVFPGEVEVYILPPNAADWGKIEIDFENTIMDRQHVWITYSITRGKLGADKAVTHFGAFVDILEEQGFHRQTIENRSAAKYHGRWTRQSGE